jgi:hypothetical protein
VAWLDFSGRQEMKNKSGGDACRNGNECAPQPIRKNAKGKYQQASQQSDFDKDQSHGRTTEHAVVAQIYHWRS